MQVVEITEFGSVDKLKGAERMAPSPGAGEVRIRLKATAVNPVDYKLRQGLFGGELPMVLGHDLSGVVDGVGPVPSGRGYHGGDFRVGDEVYCYAGGVKSNGTYAQWVCVPSSFVAYKPDNLSFAEAAAVPLVGLTAYEAVVTKARIQPGDTVLITGATGGVGSMAVQLCRHFGATKVLATAGSQKSVDHLTRVLGIPAEDVIRHPGRSLEELEAEVREKNGGRAVRAAFDFVGHRMKHLCLRAIDFGGSVVSIVEEASNFEHDIFNGRNSPLFNKSASLHFEFLGARALFGKTTDWPIYSEELETLAGLFMDGKLRPPAITHLGAFSEATIRDAHTRLEAGDVQGKLVVTFD